MEFGVDMPVMVDKVISDLTDPVSYLVGSQIPRHEFFELRDLVSPLG